MEIIKNVELVAELETVIKRFPLSQKSYKFLKKMVIDLDLDTDGKISLDAIGKCMDIIIEEKSK